MSKHLKLALVMGGVLIISGGATAGAASLISGSQIKKNSIPLNRLSKGTQNKIKAVSGQSVVPGPRGATGANGAKGDTGATGAAGAKGDKGDKGDTGSVEYVGAHWGQIDRNTIGSPVAQLRSGPYVGAGTGAGAPPLGEGSLGLNVGTVSDTSDIREKVSFGNQVDFVGDDVADITDVSFGVFWTGEDKTRSAENLPNITFEVDPTGITASGVNFSSLVFIPAGGAALPPNQWNSFNATTSGTWYFTGAAGTATGCALSTPCSFSAMKTAAATTYPDMDVLSLAVVKGRDTTFQGAVDALRYNNEVYDFEPFGVITRTP